MADPVTQSLPMPDAKPGLLARLFPPLTPAQVAVMAQVKLPCC
ncbi:MAG: hypothetical protein RSE12_18390 [Fuscovulum sp.]|jgi:hypothetical protein|nr:hypothetical protein [Paracoccaceae bacterium]MCZ8084833.1 hypothetical protein [Paracoccaceae bacterium]WRH62312.1 MAG: hypothetical protein RSE12_18390 [Fuscovulum sp.]